MIVAFHLCQNLFSWFIKSYFTVGSFITRPPTPQTKFKVNKMFKTSAENRLHATWWEDYDWVVGSENSSSSSQFPCLKLQFYTCELPSPFDCKARELHEIFTRRESVVYFLMSINALIEVNGRLCHSACRYQFSKQSENTMGGKAESVTKLLETRLLLVRETISVTIKMKILQRGRIKPV